VLTQAADGALRVEERRFGAAGELLGSSRFTGRDGQPWLADTAPLP
jgi:hypothetical protein